MTYDKKKTLKRLQRPYAYTKRMPQSVEMKILRGHINRINKRSGRPGDFIQNKKHFSDKVSKVVKVPRLYAYTTYPEKVRKWLEKNTDISEFVIKPNHLSRGVAIHVFKRLEDNRFQDTNGDILTIQDIIDECSAVVKLKRYKGIPAIIIQERIISHPDFNTNGLADIRMLYWNNHLLFSCIRIPTKESGWYGNIHRGADFGFSISGKYINNDNRFFPASITKGDVPFFHEMTLAGQKVTQLFGLRFMAVDMTIDQSGTPVVIEAERSPQIHYYLTKTGAIWLMRKLQYKPDMYTTKPLRNKKRKKRSSIPAIYFRG